jgi:hypothetical protein
MKSSLPHRFAPVPAGQFLKGLAVKLRCRD